jgi:hypothetical protein
MKKDEIILEQYKLYVGTAEKVSDKRESSNKFYLTINSVIVTFLGYLLTTPTKTWYFIIAILGLLISFSWIVTIKSYAQLNKGKYHVIHKIEEKLPLKLFKEEWDFLTGEKKKNYRRLTKVESFVPFIFMVFYILIFIFLC